ncbi:MAG TPA: alginate lyase family protein, partial [Polyangiaceae bacterium]|nr:alginate lyase family protein [Polyangiaceae bacterium]
PAAGSGGGSAGGEVGGASGSGGGVVDAPRPRLISTQAELARVVAAVSGAAEHPMKQGWEKLSGTKFAPLTYQATPHAVVEVKGSGTTPAEAALRNDAVAAYAQALSWVVTGDAQHSQKAIEIMRDWSAVLSDVVPEAGSPDVQDELEVAWYAPIWLNAAELIRYYDGGAAGWSAEDIALFDGMVELFKAKADGWAGSQGCCPNQAISVIFSRLSIAVYTGDTAYRQAALDTFTDSVLPRSIADSGEVLEINRIDGGDCGHATYNIEGIFDIAEVAWHQGIDLYADPRLSKGLEYLAQCITEGVDTSSEGFVHCADMRPSSVEIAYNHYTHRAQGYALPRTEALLELLRPSDQGSGKFIPWDTLTHADLDQD